MTDEVIVIPWDRSVMERMESGAIQFGNDDWPGIFIRGDYALHYAFLLENLLKSLPEDRETIDVLAESILGCLVSELRSCAIQRKENV